MLRSEVTLWDALYIVLIIIVVAVAYIFYKMGLKEGCTQGYLEAKHKYEVKYYKEQITVDPSEKMCRVLRKAGENGQSNSRKRPSK